MNPIYLDYNATTPIDPEVADAMIPFIRNHFGNPSSSHSLGKFNQRAIEEARQNVADLIGAQSDEIYFTSGGTESNNLTIKGIFFKEGQQSDHFVTSCFEHPAVKQPALFHESQGGSVTWIDTDKDGVVNTEQIEQACHEQTRLVSIMHSNNEIGTLQPIREIADFCSLREIPIHTDASQSLGKVPVNVDELGVDFLTIAGHKLYAPKGIGALFIRAGQSLAASIHGANHEKGVRPGTENVPYIVGLGVAAKLAREKEESNAARLESLRDRLERGIVDKIHGVRINGSNASRLPNTSSLTFPHVVAANMLSAISDLCVSTGAACHSGVVQLSDTLRAIGLNEEQGAGTVRISCGRYTTEEEIDQAVAILLNAWQEEFDSSNSNRTH